MRRAIRGGIRSGSRAARGSVVCRPGRVSPVLCSAALWRCWRTRTSVRRDLSPHRRAARPCSTSRSHSAHLGYGAIIARSSRGLFRNGSPSSIIMTSAAHAAPGSAARRNAGRHTAGSPGRPPPAGHRLSSGHSPSAARRPGRGDRPSWSWSPPAPPRGSRERAAAARVTAAVDECPCVTQRRPHRALLLAVIGGFVVGWRLCHPCLICTGRWICLYPQDCPTTGAGTGFTWGGFQVVPIELDISSPMQQGSRCCHDGPASRGQPTRPHGRSDGSCGSCVKPLGSAQRSCHREFIKIGPT